MCVTCGYMFTQHSYETVCVLPRGVFILGPGRHPAQSIASFYSTNKCLVWNFVKLTPRKFLIMSASPIARQATHSQSIPSRRVLITDPAQMPDVYSSTPGGTIYSTTPGGTRIVYERSFMLSLRQSPISQTPPQCALPAALLKNPSSVPNVQPASTQKPRSNSISFDESQETFSMDL